MFRKFIGSPKSRGLLATTVISAFVTISVGWYQIADANKRARRVDQERAKAMKQTITTHVVQQIVDGQPIDLFRLARLIETGRKRDSITIEISVLDVIKEAEYAIALYPHVDSNDEKLCMERIDGLLSRLLEVSAPRLPEGPHSKLFHTMSEHIREGRSVEALQELRRLAELTGELEAKASERASSDFPSALRTLFIHPGSYLLFLTIFFSVKVANSLFAFVFSFLRTREKLIRNQQDMLSRWDKAFLGKSGRGESL